MADRVSLSNLEFGDHNDDVKTYQKALKAKGFDPGPIDGVFGNMTKDATKRFQRAQGWSGSDADGAPGAQTISRLGLALRPGSGTVMHASGEPTHDYTRTKYGGKRVNQRTKVMLESAAGTFGQSLILAQGSYNLGVAASAGTHDGGGVVDVSVHDWSRSKMDRAVQELRKAGFAAWLRVPPAFSFHIHAVAIGDRDLSSAARSQITQWQQDRNGLANFGPDPAPDPYPAWTQRYR
ncbi:peptidoglycan-binding domain-containing protein [Streptomyces tanashiensis]|uniref:peptidoglycan-binding domain-containing protein n=1 Tax=Streptomyces tanashiensis TaxID=67367 RepID=UPI003430D19C